MSGTFRNELPPDVPPGLEDDIGDYLLYEKVEWEATCDPEHTISELMFDYNGTELDNS